MLLKKTKIACWIGVLGWVAVCGVPSWGDDLADQDRATDYEALFNGQDLTGWHIMGNEAAWVVEDEMIHALPGLRGGFIQSDRSFEDFILRLEYKTGKNANSGVFIHLPQHGRQSRVGGEIQIFDSYGKEPSKYSAGALYDKIPPLVTASRPTGEWNALEIQYQFPKLKVTLNETIVQDLDLAQDERLRWRKRFGPIGVQEHGNDVWLRNVRIKDLGGSDEALWKQLFNYKNFDGWKRVGNTDEWRVKESMTIIKIKNGGADQKWNYPRPFEEWNLLKKAKFKTTDPCIKAEWGKGFMVTEKKYRNYHLWAYVKTRPYSGGGIWPRWNSLESPGEFVTLWNNPRDDYKTGSIAIANDRLRAIEKTVVPANGRYSADDDWFPIQVVCNQGQLTTLVSGQIVSKHTCVDETAPIGLGLFVKGGDGVLFKDVRIQELD